MRSVEEHLTAVLKAVGPVTPIDASLADSAGCILAEDLMTTAELPAHPLAECDGYALRAEDTYTPGVPGPVLLPVLHDASASDAEPLRLVGRTAVRVSSGAPLPIGADVVVPLEETDRGAARVSIRERVVPGGHVRRAGVDAVPGAVLVAAGTRLGPRQLALAAAIGRLRLRVHPTPRVVILCIGNELVEPGSAGVPGTVFDANGHALTSAVHDAGAAAFRVGQVSDSRSALRESLEDQLVRADLLLTVGGLSEAEGDTAADVLGQLGNVRFDRIAMSPGSRQGFGTIGDGVPIFALPGHPVAAQVSFEVFVRPALRSMAGYAELYRSSVLARAKRGWTSPAGIREFVPVEALGFPDQGYEMTPTGEPGTVSLSALALANAFAVVPEARTRVVAGDELRCLVLEG